MKYRAEVTGKGEDVWSANGKEYNTEQEAKDWLDDLGFRWTGYDASRVVTVDTPRQEAFDATDSRIYQNWRR